MAKRDRFWGNTKYSALEEDFLRRLTDVLEIEASEFVRQCIALASSQLLYNPHCRRSKLEDAINGMGDAVNKLWNERNTRG